MWFKQIQIFELLEPIDESILVENLSLLEFQPCTPSMFSSMGWVAPLEGEAAEEEAPLVVKVDNYLMLCLQIEEKILPSTVIQQTLSARIKEIESLQGRKVRQKEKYALKDEIIRTLLLRAFSRLTKLFAYIDIKNNWLVLGTANEKKAAQFLSLFHKTATEAVFPFDTQNLSSILTQWLLEQNYPSSFSIEKACVLQDPSHQNRMLRCQEQDLFSRNFQSLLKDGLEAKQVAFCWHDQVNFMLSNNLTLQSVSFHDELRAQSKEMDTESIQQQFNADFLIMAKTISKLFGELLNIITIPNIVASDKKSNRHLLKAKANTTPRFDTQADAQIEELA